MLNGFERVGRALLLVLVIAGAIPAQASYRHVRDMIPASAGPVLGAADFDLDGDQDLLTNATGIYLNDGHGRFTPHPIFSNVNVEPSNSGNPPLPVVAIGDLNGDLLPDVLAWNGSYVEKWLNTGNAVLAFVAWTAVPAGVTAVALGDVDQDGDLDAVIATNASAGATLRLWKNGGTGILTDTPAQMPTQTFKSSQVALRDFDADGDLDLLAGAGFGSANAPGLFLNNGLGFFLVAPIMLPAAATQRVFAIGNVNNDGLPDVVFDTPPTIVGVACTMNVAPMIAVNAGGGVFTPMPTAALTLPMLGTIPHLVDADGNGVDDLVRLTNAGAQIHYLTGGFLGPAAATVAIYQAPGIESVGWADYPYGSLVVDVDVDGDEDLVVSGPQGNQIAFHMTSGPFIPVQDYLAAYWNASVDPVEVGDIDGNGDLDLFLGFSNCPSFQHAIVYAPMVHLAMNDGSGVLTEAPPLPVAGGTPFQDGPTVLFDADLDGDLDVFLASGGFPLTGYVFLNGGASFSLNQTLPVLGIGYTNALKHGDLDSDGDQDVVAASAGTIDIFLGNGPGLIVHVFSLPSGANDFELVDWDGDGDLDILAVSQVIQLWANNGVAGFSPVAGMPMTGGLSLEVADLDADGDLDLLVNNLVLLRSGSSFVPGATLAPHIASIPKYAVFDVDADGDLDVVDTFGWAYVNVGNAIFGAPQVLPFAAQPWQIVHADFDKDGDEDLVSKGPSILTNTTRQLSRGHPPRIGRPASLELAGAPGTVWALFASWNAASAPLSPYGTILIDPASAFLVATGILPPSGTTTIAGVLPNASSLVGITLYAQALFAESVGPRLTGRETLTIASY